MVSAEIGKCAVRMNQNVHGERRIFIGIAHSISEMFGDRLILSRNVPAAGVEGLVHEDWRGHSGVVEEVCNRVSGLKGVHWVSFVIHTIYQDLIAECRHHRRHNIWNLQTADGSPGAEEGQQDGFSL